MAAASAAAGPGASPAQLSYTLQAASFGGVVPVRCSDGSEWYNLLRLLGLAGYTSGGDILVYWAREWTPPLVLRTVHPKCAGGGSARVTRVMSRDAFKGVLLRLNGGRKNAAADDAIASWAGALGVSLDEVDADTSGGDAAGSDADEAEDAEEAEEAEEAGPAVPHVPRPKGRQKLAPPTGAEFGCVADARGRALRVVALRLADAARKSTHTGLLVGDVNNEQFEAIVAAAAPPVPNFRAAHGRGTVLVRVEYSWLYQAFIATHGLLRPADKIVAKMRFRFALEMELRGRMKNLVGAVTLVSLVLWRSGASSSSVQMLNRVTGGVMSSNYIRDRLANFLKTREVYDEIFRLVERGRLFVAMIDNIFTQYGRVRIAALLSSLLTHALTGSSCPRRLRACMPCATSPHAASTSPAARSTRGTRCLRTPLTCFRTSTSRST